jgi:hypothetical protein
MDCFLIAPDHFPIVMDQFANCSDRFQIHPDRFAIDADRLLIQSDLPSDPHGWFCDPYVAENDRKGETGQALS